LEALLPALKPERDASRHPLFQVMCNLVERGAPPALPGLDVELAALRTGWTKLDLTLTAVREVRGRAAGEALHLAFDFARDLFEEVPAARWLGHLEALLAGAAADPELPLAALPLLGAGERWQLLGEWARGEAVAAAPAAGAECIHLLVRRQ